METSYPDNIPLIGRARRCIDAIKVFNLKGKTIIDVGCSFGWIENTLSNSGAKFVGIDPEQKAVDFATKHSKGEFSVGSALDIPVKSARGDVVLFFDVIEHLPAGTEKRAFKEINRALKKNGVLILTTPNNNLYSNLSDPAWYFGHRHYKKDVLLQMLTESGFKITDHKIIGNFLAPVYTIWFYLVKHIFKIRHPRNSLMERISDIAYDDNNGIIEHLVYARKIKTI